jgi:hypothetical protein
MKLSAVLLTQAMPSSGAFSTACLKADKGFDLTLNESARLIAAKHGDIVKLIPLERVLSMDPMPAEKAAKK